MKCRETRRLFPLYYDSEGDAAVQLDIADHLASCPSCQDWFSLQARCEDAVVGLLARGDATPGAWSAIEDRVRAHAAPSRPAVRFRFWIGSTVLLAMAASVLAAVMLWPGAGTRAAHADLLPLAAAAHDCYVHGRWEPAVQSESVVEVEEALRPQAGFEVRCPPQGQAGFRLRGGGLCQLGREAAVHIVGDVQGQPVSIIVLPGEALDSFPRTRRHLAAGAELHRCREGSYAAVAALLHGHVVVALGEISPDVLAEILHGYGNHHAAHASPRPALADRAPGDALPLNSVSAAGLTVMDTLPLHG
jgi:hypothetical protein